MAYVVFVEFSAAYDTVWRLNNVFKFLKIIRSKKIDMQCRSGEYYACMQCE